MVAVACALPDAHAVEAPGTKLWELQVPGAVTTSPALGKDGTIYFGYTFSDDVQLPGGRTLHLSTNFTRAVSTNGQTQWEATLDGNTLAVGPDQTIYQGGAKTVQIGVLPSGQPVSGFTPSVLTATRSDGSLSWRRDDVMDFAIGGEGGIYAAITLTNDAPAPQRYRVAALSTAGTVLRQNPSDADSFAGARLLIGPDGTCFLGPEAVVTTALPSGATQTVTKPALAFDGETLGNPTPISEDSQLAQTFNSLINPAYGNCVIGNDGTIYYGTMESNLCAMTSSREIQWQFAAGAAISTSPALAQDGTIYCTTEGGVLFAISSGGVELWRFNAGGPIKTSPVIGTNGVVYFGADDGKLYAIQGAAPLAKSPWPMYRHDAAHTGRAFQLGLRAEPTGVANQHQLRLSLEPFTTYRIEASNDLIHWQPSFTYNGEGGIFRLIRSAASGPPYNFYRLAAIPGN